LVVLKYFCKFAAVNFCILEPTPANKNKKLPRTERVTFVLNEKEQKAFDRYCERYHVQNRSRFVRQLLMRAILRRFNEDQPTLF